MCGIVAICSDRRPIDKELLKHTVEVLHHRGPDCQKCWIDPSGTVGLGHARLSIIDLTTGDQPIHNEDNTRHIVVNGELYNHDEIMHELQRKGHRFQTCSDSEIALHLYEDYGTDCLTKLRGEFAFSLWDAPNKMLFAARDRFGIKPLYYSLYKDTLYMASEIKALLNAGVPARWNEDYFIHMADVFIAIQNQTLFKGIHQVPPGHFLLYRNNHLQIYKYWDFDYLPAADIPLNVPEEDLIEGFREKFNEAVRLRMRADVPVGAI